MPKYIKRIGIDFGSSNTCVVAFIEGESTPVILGKDAPTFESFMLLTKDGKYKFFSEAVNASFREREGSCGYVYFNKLKESISGVEGKENVLRFLNELFHKVINDDEYQVKGYDMSRLESVYYGYPAYYEPSAIEHYKEAFEDVLRQCFKGISKKQLSIVGYPEPLLAGVAYNYIKKDLYEYSKGITAGDLMLILDFGGHTLDLSVARFEAVRNGTVLVKHCDPGSFTRFVPMGKELTRLLCQVVYKRLAPFDYAIENAKCELFSSSDWDKNKVVAKLIRPYQAGAKTATITYRASDTAGDGICVSMCGSRVKIEDIFRKFTDCISEYLKQKSIGSNSIKHILFTGGASKMIPLREAIVKGLKPYLAPRNFVYIMDDSTETAADFACESQRLSSENAVALGAAILAGDSALRNGLETAAKPKPAPTTVRPQSDKERLLINKISQIKTVVGAYELEQSPDVKELFRELNKILDN